MQNEALEGEKNLRV
jgi:hypothetical protein